MNQQSEEILKEFRIKKQELDDLISEIRDLQDKEDDLKKDLLILDEELKYWEKEIQKLGKNQEMAEEILLWKDEIKTLKNKIEIKNQLATQIDAKLKNKINNSNNLKREFEICSNSLKIEILKNLKKIDLKSIGNDLDELNYLLQVLKDVLCEINLSKLDLASFLKILKSNNIIINNDILSISNRIFGLDEIILLPELITEFINEIITRLNPKNILYPWPVNGFMMGSLLNRLKEINTTCIINKKNEKELFETFYNNLKINWEYNEDNSLNNLNFNVIVGYNTHNDHKITIKLRSNKGEIELFDNISFIELLNAALKLEKNGTGFFIIESNFLLSLDKK